jgi:hypothetical protein
MAGPRNGKKASEWLSLLSERPVRFQKDGAPHVFFFAGASASNAWRTRS